MAPTLPEPNTPTTNPFFRPQNRPASSSFGPSSNCVSGNHRFPTSHAHEMRPHAETKVDERTWGVAKADLRLTCRKRRLQVSCSENGKKEKNIFFN